MRPPYGWVAREEPDRNRFIGFDFGVAWPLVALYVGGLVLGYPTFLRSLVIWAAAVSIAVAAALLRGFDLTVSQEGFVVWQTWCGIPYWRVVLPLDAKVELVGGFGEPPDRVVIERSLHSEDVSLGSASTCEELYVAISTAQARFRNTVRLEGRV